MENVNEPAEGYASRDSASVARPSVSSARASICPVPLAPVPPVSAIDIAPADFTVADFTVADLIVADFLLSYAIANYAVVDETVVRGTAVNYSVPRGSAAREANRPAQSRRPKRHATCAQEASSSDAISPRRTPIQPLLPKSSVGEVSAPPPPSGQPSAAVYFGNTLEPASAPTAASTPALASASISVSIPVSIPVPALVPLSADTPANADDGADESDARSESVGSESQSEPEQLSEGGSEEQPPKFAAYSRAQAEIDSAMEQDRVAARAMAVRARNIDTARRAVEEATGRGKPGKSDGWGQDTIADRTITSMVSCALRIPERTAESLIDASRMLVDELPATMAALEAGDISYRHAAKMVDHAYYVAEEDRVQLETELLDAAKKLTVAQFDRRARRAVEKIAPASPEERQATAIENRSVEVLPADDGMAILQLHMSAVDAVAIYNRADDIARSLQGPGEERTLTQLRVDVLSELMLTGVTNDNTGAGIVPTVAIHVPMMTLLEHGDEPAFLETYGPISAEEALKLVGKAKSLTRILTHPENGTVLSVGRERYKVPAAMRLWLQIRDQICRFPGCSRPARGCDLDHCLDWQYGGCTEVTNLACLCSRHHDLKHRTDWTYTQDQYGNLEWVSPSGVKYVTEPGMRLQGDPPDTGPSTTSDATSEMALTDVPPIPIPIPVQVEALRLNSPQKEGDALRSEEPEDEEPWSEGLKESDGPKDAEPKTKRPLGEWPSGERSSTGGSSTGGSSAGGPRRRGSVKAEQRREASRNEERTGASGGKRSAKQKSASKQTWTGPETIYAKDADGGWYIPGLPDENLPF